MLVEGINGGLNCDFPTVRQRRLPLLFNPLLKLLDKSIGLL